MTEKELYRLHRPDLLQLLYSQGKEAADLQSQLDGSSETLAETQDVVERLKTKLDEKDVLIEKLKRRLDEKDAAIQRQQKELHALRANNRLMLEFIEDSAYRFNGIFEAAHRAADQYLYSLRQMCGECKTDCPETNEDSLPSKEVSSEE